MEIIAVIAGIVGLIWGVVTIRQSGLAGGCLMVLLAGSCFSVPFLRVECGPIPLTIDRVLLVLLALQYIVWRRFGLADPKPIGKPEIVLLTFLALLIISTFTHDWKSLGTKTPYQPASWLITNYLMPAVLYWIARQMKIGERESLMIFGGFALFGVYLAVVSLAEYAWLAGYSTSWMVFPNYIVASASDKEANFVGRARGPLLNAIGNGMMLSVCLTAALFWWPHFRRKGRTFLTAAIALSLGAMYFTLTRSVWIGGVLAIVLVLVPALPRGRRLPLVGCGIFLGAVLAATQWDNIMAFKRDRSSSAADAAMSVELRPVLARIAWNIFCEHPLFGCGYGQYGAESNIHAFGRDGDLDLAKGRNLISHNVFLSLLAETGIVGLSLFMVLLALWARDAWRLWRNESLPLAMRQAGLWLPAALGSYVVNGMFHEVSVVIMVNMTLFFIAGVAAGLRAQPQPNPIAAQ